MKRIIKFSIDPKKENYIFQEDNIQEDNINIFKINVKDKILNGKDFYKIFFQNYNPDDKFEFIDNTSDQ
ncbi:unknown [Coprobacillus sp. CAG:698]|nr:unknown [Coprobacillus sp. CAG:698]